MVASVEGNTYIAFRCVFTWYYLKYVLFYYCGIACSFVYLRSLLRKYWIPTCEGVVLISRNFRNAYFTKLSTLQDIKCLRVLTCNLCVVS